MRKHLFATDEILIPVDAMELQDNAGLDTSSLLAAMAGVADANVTSGIDAQAVLVGLTTTAVVSASEVVVTVQPGTVIYKVADTDNVTWKLATLRDVVTLKTTLATVADPLVPGDLDKHKHVFVEVVVTETTTNATRQFRRELAGRVVTQNEVTPKYRQANVTLRLRTGTEMANNVAAYLPAWDALALPISRLYITTTTVTATDIRRLYRSYCGSTTFFQPLQAQTDVIRRKFPAPSLYPSTMIEKNYVGFGIKSAIDYCETSVWSTTHPTPGGVVFPLAPAYTPTANSMGYVYAYRVHPKVNAVEYMVSPTVPDADRNITSGTFSAPAPWPIGTTSSGTEIKYLFPQHWFATDDLVSAKTVRGSSYEYGVFAPTKTFANVSSSVQTTFDVSDLLPPFTQSAAFRVKIVFTLASPALTHFRARVGYVLFYDASSDTLNMPMYESPATVTLELPAMTVNINRSVGMQFDAIFDATGTNVGTFDVTLTPTTIHESYRQ